jgi:hypothetical protein
MAQSTTVAIYATHEQADTAVKALQKSGFDLRKLSIVGKDFRTEEHAIGYYNTGDRVRFWGRTGAFWGGLAGILFSSAFLIIPVVGHVIVLGPLVTSLIGGLEGAAVGGGTSALFAALVGLGIPKDTLAGGKPDDHRTARVTCCSLGYAALRAAGALLVPYVNTRGPR